MTSGIANSGSNSTIKDGVGDCDKIYSTGCHGCCHYDSRAASTRRAEDSTRKEQQFGSKKVCFISSELLWRRSVHRYR